MQREIGSSRALHGVIFLRIYFRLRFAASQNRNGRLAAAVWIHDCGLDQNRLVQVVHNLLISGRDGAGLREVGI